MPTVVVQSMAVATAVSAVGVNTVRTVSVPDIASAVTVSSPGVNTEHTVSVASMVSSVSVETPSLYTTPIGGHDKVVIGTLRYPVQDGYTVRAVEDFTSARYDGGISAFRKDRQHSQPMWKVSAKFVLPTEGEYQYTMAMLLSGAPFETELVIDSVPAATFRCWPIPESVSLGRIPHTGFEVAVEFFATEVV